MTCVAPESVFGPRDMYLLHISENSLEDLPQRKENE